MSIRPITGRTVFYLFAAFFGGVAVMNAFFIWLALDSFPGLETRNSYRQGLSYDRELKAAASQRALGWQAALEWRSIRSGSGRLVLDISDRGGRPVEGLVVTAELRRPVHDEADIIAPLKEVKSGRYEALLNLSGAGNWRVSVHARRADSEDFRLRQRMVVP